MICGRYNRLDQLEPSGTSQALSEFATIPWFRAEGSCDPGYVSDIDHAQMNPGAIRVCPTALRVRMMGVGWESSGPLDGTCQLLCVCS